MRFTGTKDPSFESVCQKAHNEAVEILRPRLPQIFPELEKLEVNLNQRLSVCAGKACSKRLPLGGFSSHQIKLNHRLLSDNPKEIAPTYIHELMHIVASILYPKERVGHGLRWKLLMNMVGQSDERCHTMNVTAYRKPRLRYVYGCTVEGCSKKFHLTGYKHRKQEERRAYRCRCGGSLKYLEGPVAV